MGVRVVAATGGCVECFLEAVRFPVTAGESRLRAVQLIGEVIERSKLVAFEHRSDLCQEGLLVIWTQVGAPTSTWCRFLILTGRLCDASCQAQWQESDDVHTGEPQQNLQYLFFLVLCHFVNTKDIGGGTDSAACDPVGRA